MNDRPATFSEAGPYWAVAQVMPGHEIRSRKAIEDVGFDVELPAQKRTKTIRNRRVLYAHFIFPGYLFFKVADQDWTLVLSNGDVRPPTHVVRVLTDTQADLDALPRPARVRPGYVEQVRAAMREHGGYMPTERRQAFAAGQRVQVDDLYHLLYGHVGFYEAPRDEDHANIQINMFGGKRSVIVRERDLIAA
jgi:transcription termination factor NusG